MRNFVLILLCAVATTFCLVACNIETSGNGDLDGYWSLRQIDTLSTSAAADVSERRIFWSFQHQLLQTDDRTNTYASCLFRFHHGDGVLTVSYEGWDYAVQEW